jgi:hypothetical protein
MEPSGRNRWQPVANLESVILLEAGAVEDRLHGRREAGRRFPALKPQHVYRPTLHA